MRLVWVTGTFQGDSPCPRLTAPDEAIPTQQFRTPAPSSSAAASLQEVITQPLGQRGACLDLPRKVLSGSAEDASGAPSL